MGDYAKVFFLTLGAFAATSCGRIPFARTNPASPAETTPDLSANPWFYQKVWNRQRSGQLEHGQVARGGRLFRTGYLSLVDVYEAFPLRAEDRVSFDAASAEKLNRWIADARAVDTAVPYADQNVPPGYTIEMGGYDTEGRMVIFSQWATGRNGGPATYYVNPAPSTAALIDVVNGFFRWGGP